MKVLQTDLLLDEVVVFRGKIGDEVFNGNAGIDFALPFQFLQLLVRSADIESVEDGPVEVEADVNCLVVDSIIGDLSGGTGFRLDVVQVSGISGRKVQSRQITCISECRVILADLFFVMDDAQRIIVLQPFFQAVF